LKEQAKNWLESANADLKNIKYILNDDYLTHVVAFHAQQCVEKSLKSVLAKNGIKIPKSHSTISLFAKVKTVMSITINEDILIDLDDLYINTRYPGNFGLLPDGKPTLEEAKEFYDFALNIFTLVH
jgi:HEPN domain-containing protein